MEWPPIPPYKIKLNRYDVIVKPARGDGGGPSIILGSLRNFVLAPLKHACDFGAVSSSHNSFLSLIVESYPVYNHSIFLV